MSNPAIKHYPTCTPNYPEKPKGEKPQQIEVDHFGEETIHTCVDCGAYVITRGEEDEEDEDDAQ